MNKATEISLDYIWDKVKENLNKTLTNSAYQTFLASATPISLENSNLLLSVPNEFSKNWFKDFCEKIVLSLFEQHNHPVIISYNISPTLPKETEQLSIFDKEKSTKNKQLFNPIYSFDSFVVGQNNRFAHASCYAVAKEPAKIYNPLFIYGSAGLGKTHLLHAVAHQVLEKNSNAKILLVSCETFTNDMINAIKDKKLETFRDKYRFVDVLIVDDIQFLSGKEQTQEEFFHTFNDLHSQKKQIILTSDRPPKNILTLEERLRTRFEWGLIADIQPPELETRIAILKKKTELNKTVLADEILHFIASQMSGNVREMEGALNRVFAYTSLMDTPMTLSIASRVISDMVTLKNEKPITISRIQIKTSDLFNISVQDLNSKCRTKEIAHARQIAMYLSRELTKSSLPEIGKKFGNRDHTTVIHACEKVKKELKDNSETQKSITFLINVLKQE
ncbi:MAG: chromosomal replication initiator protein DnaA [bacterium]